MEIKMHFIPAEVLAGMRTVDKINMIIDSIKKNIIVVLEEGLTPQEEAELIEATMREIDAENFHGIEFFRVDKRNKSLREKLADKIAGRKSGFMIVGPTRMIEEIKKETNYVVMLARVDELCRINAQNAEESMTKEQKK